MVAVDGVVFFQVLDAAKAAYEVSDLYLAIMQLTTTNLRTVMGSMDLDETLSKRDEINARLLVVVDQATESLGGQDHPRRDQGHPPARRHRQRHGPADEGRAREARPDPRIRGPARLRDPQGRGPEAGPDPRRPKAAARPPSATPRRASAPPRPRPRRPRWSPTRSPAATPRRSTISSPRNMSRRSASSPTSPNAKTILFPVEATAADRHAGRDRRARHATRSARATRAARRRGAARSREASNDVFDGLGRHWWWLLAAALLGILEIFVPGIFLVWMAAAAAVTGAHRRLDRRSPSPFQLGHLRPARHRRRLSAAAAIMPATRSTSDDPKLNDRAARLIGQTGHGRDRDREWRGPGQGRRRRLERARPRSAERRPRRRGRRRGHDLGGGADPLGSVLD